MGAPYLREALSGYASSEFGADVPPENVMVTPGGRFAVFLAMSLLNPGDEIAVIEPAWPAYRECAQNAGVRVRSIRTSPEDGWEPSVEQVRRAIGQNTRMLVLNYPNNPTGKILEPRLQKGIVDAAAESGIYVLSDEIYWRYAYSDWISVLRSGYEKSVVVQSFSKSHAMTGFRVGYTMADPEILGRMARLQALAITSVAEPVQYAAMHALEADISPNSETIRSRLAALSDRAREMGLDFVEPQGAMYLFARTGDGVGLAENLLERGVAVAPGEAFGDYGDHIRISACQDKKTLMEGMDMIRGMRDQK
jgi:aspartate aminotransferase